MFKAAVIRAGRTLTIQVLLQSRGRMSARALAEMKRFERDLYTKPAALRASTIERPKRVSALHGWTTRRRD